MKKAAAILCMCAAVLMVSCAKKNNNPTGPGGGDNTMTMTYTMLGTDRIVISNPQEISTETYCNGNTLVTLTDTSEASTDTMGFELSGNGDTLSIEGMIFARTGTGTGIQGSWTSTMGSVQIGPSTITVIESSSSDADYFIEDWIDDPQADNVTVTKASANSVTMTGNTTGEIVTITFSSTGISYSSTLSEHAAGTYYYNPTSCPNNDPEWYYEFLMANSSGFNKKAVTAPSALSHGIFSVLLKNHIHHQ
jgi:hypothetical protein